MSDPVSWLASAAERYGPTAAGLAIGTAARYGLSLNEGRRVTWRGVVADLLLLSFLGLIALTSGDVLGSFGVHVSGDARVLSGALAAVSSDRLARLVRERFLKRIDAQLGGDGADIPAA